MRVLVTGGAGYIGSVVTEELVAAGHHTVVFDSLYKGHREAVVPEARLVVADLADREALRATVRDERIEAVVHMAADSLVGESVVDPAIYYRNNVSVGLGMLDVLRDEGVSMLVFSSTAAVYGEPAKQPIEEGDPTAPTNPYGETKLAFERALGWYRGAYGLRSISLRYFNAAGASERNGEQHDPETHLVPIVLQVAAGTRSEVTIFGDDYPTPDGTCVRDYIHVVDLARAHVAALEALAGGAEGRAYNLGCGSQGYSVKQVVETARRITGRPIPTKVGARRAGDPAVLVASSALAAKELGFRPLMDDLDSIVGSAWKWLQSRSR